MDMAHVTDLKSKLARRRREPASAKKRALFIARDKYMSITKIYLTEDRWAFDKFATTIGALPGISDRNEKLWTMLGALLLELSHFGINEAIIYNDTRLVEEWNEDVAFINALSIGIARRLKDRGGLASKFNYLSLEKLDTLTINSEIDKFQLI